MTRLRPDGGASLGGEVVTDICSRNLAGNLLGGAGRFDRIRAFLRPQRSMCCGAINSLGDRRREALRPPQGGNSAKSGTGNRLVRQAITNDTSRMGDDGKVRAGEGERYAEAEALQPFAHEGK